jgi:hypothetical protein
LYIYIKGPVELLTNQYVPMGEDWRGDEQREDLINFLQLEGSPILHHMRLYEVAKAVHSSQVSLSLSPPPLYVSPNVHDERQFDVTACISISLYI